MLYTTKLQHWHIYLETMLSHLVTVSAHTPGSNSVQVGRLQHLHIYLEAMMPPKISTFTQNKCCTTQCLPFHHLTIVYFELGNLKAHAQANFPPSPPRTLCSDCLQSVPQLITMSRATACLTFCGWLSIPSTSLSISDRKKELKPQNCHQQLSSRYTIL